MTRAWRERPCRVVKHRHHVVDVAMMIRTADLAGPRERGAHGDGKTHEHNLERLCWSVPRCTDYLGQLRATDIRVIDNEPPGRADVTGATAAAARLPVESTPRRPSSR